MKYLLNRSGLLVLAAMLVIGITAQAQPSNQSDEKKAEAIVLNAEPGSTMMVTGTSTIHDWEVEVKDYTASVELKQPVSDTALAKIGDYLAGAKVTVPVENMESGKGGMNKKIYGAFDTDKHPNIVYTLEKASLASELPDSADTVKLNTSGKLTMAGSTQAVDMVVNVKRIDGGKMQFTGEKKLNMTDFDMDPPSAVFGTIKAGEEVTVKFDLIVKQ